MDFRDSPDEAEFRSRIRSWLADQGDRIKRSHSDDGYWTFLGDWHQRPVRRRLLRASRGPSEYGGRELPPVYEVIVDEELAAAGAPPKPSLGYLIQGISRHGSDEIKDRFLPGLINGRDRWCQGFSEPDAGSDLAVAAHHGGARRRRVRHQRPQDLDELLRRRRVVHRARPHRSRRAQAQGHLGVRRADAAGRASSSGRCG